MKRGNILVPILVGAVFISLAAAAFFFWQTQQSKNKSVDKADTTTPSTFPKVEQEVNNWNTYKSAIAGIEFKYPENITIEEVESGPGSGATGYKFTISSKVNGQLTDLVMGGVTSDFSQGRGGMFTDTQGFVNKSGEFYCTFINTFSPIDKGVNIQQYTNDNGVEMLILKGISKVGMPNEEFLQYGCWNPGPDYTLVLINLKGSKYKGMAVELKNNSPFITSKQLLTIISTFKIIESRNEISNNKTYTSPGLGITFQYLSKTPDENNYPVEVKEVGNKVYVHVQANYSKNYTNGQWLEVFSKDTSKSLEQSVKEKFLNGYSDSDCQIKLSSLQTFELAKIEVPIEQNDSLETMSAKWDKCPTPYTTTNGLSYFLMDPKRPSKFIYFSIGQYFIQSGENDIPWQDTIKFL